MSQLAEDNPLMERVHKEFYHFMTNPEMQEKAKQRQRSYADFMIMFNAAMDEGKAKAEIKIIQRMKKAGLDIKMIAELASLSPEAVEHILSH